MAPPRTSIFKFWMSLSTHTISTLRTKKSKQICVKSFDASYHNHAWATIWTSPRNQSKDGMRTTHICATKMSGDQNALILKAFCKIASTDPGIHLQLASIIDYNASNINDEINKAFTLLTKLLYDGRKSSSHSQCPPNAKMNANRASAASVTATTQASAKVKLPQYSSTSHPQPKDGIKPCWACKTTDHKTFDCWVI